MLAPFRRSLSERAVGAAIQCKACTRQIHAHGAIRTAAQAQIHEYKTFPSGSNTESALPNSSHRGSSKKSTASINPSNRRRSDPNNRQENVGGDPLLTASSLNSPHKWEESDILRLYSMPTEQQVPTQVRTKLHRREVTYNWRKDPLQYLREGLKLVIQTEGTNTNSRRIVRVKLSAGWGKEVHSAIGDGRNKVIARLRMTDSLGIRPECGRATRHPQSCQFDHVS